MAQPTPALPPIPALPPLTRRQRDILAFYRQYISREGISPTLEEVAQHFDLSKVTIFGHVEELERKGVLRRAAPGISRGLQLAGPAAAFPDPSAGGNGERGGLTILGTIAAGAPIETLETPEVLPFEELAPPGRDVYVLRVRGDSMIEDSIRDGDLVVVERRHDPRPGQTVVAVLPGEEATLKRFYREPDGRIRLQPANTAHAPLIVPEVEIRGVVIGVIRRY
ncbi:MAG: transcriptional repressor LexA [Planctomycetota bacterium]